MHRQAEPARSNLLFAALGPTRRVIMGDTLLDGFTPDEIEVVFAHEIGHHVFRHIYKLIAVGVLLSAVGFWICDQILRNWAGIGRGGIGYEQLPVASLPLLMFSLTAFSLL